MHEEFIHDPMSHSITNINYWRFLNSFIYEAETDGLLLLLDVNDWACATQKKYVPWEARFGQGFTSKSHLKVQWKTEEFLARFRRLKNFPASRVSHHRPGVSRRIRVTTQPCPPLCVVSCLLSLPRHVAPCPVSHKFCIASCRPSQESHVLLIVFSMFFHWVSCRILEIAQSCPVDSHVTRRTCQPVLPFTCLSCPPFSSLTMSLRIRHDTIDRGHDGHVPPCPAWHDRRVPPLAPLGTLVFISKGPWVFKNTFYVPKTQFLLWRGPRVHHRSLLHHPALILSVIGVKRRNFGTILTFM